MTKTGGTILGLAAALLVVSGATAQDADWRKTWNVTLAAAKQEGKVVIAGSPDPVMRNTIIPAFKARYGIPVEYIGGQSGQTAGRIKVERSSGIYSIDVYMTGPDTTYNVLYPDKMLDPLRPQLILPEVTDGKNWKPGKLTFMDPEGRHVLRLFNSVNSAFFINTDFVKPEEMRSMQDLLDPKWKGRISTEDPGSGSGKGGNTAANIYSQLGADYARKLYVGQAVMTSRDRRQLTDWLARGTYPICLTCRTDDASALQKDGFNITELHELAGMENYVNSAPFLLSIANRAPHPNAMRVFVNWMAGKEAMELYSRHYDTVTLRADLDESFLEPRTIPKPGATYRDNDSWAWRTTGKRETGAKFRALLKSQ